MRRSMNKPPDRVMAIKRLRSGAGYFSLDSMAKMFCENGAQMTRQTYANKESGKSRFDAQEVMILADVFDMTMREANDFFNGCD